MIARGFKSVIWVAAVGSAALGCYMVSLRVATERNELARVERQIVAAKRDIRSLQTELGTRGRMTQLEQWNAEVLALAAPSSAQFLKDEFTLARLYRNDPTVEERSAEVRLASAPAEAKPAEKQAAAPVVRAVAEAPAARQPMVHRASFGAVEPPAKARPAAIAASAPAKPEKPEKPAVKAEKPKPTAAPVRTAAKPESKPAAKPESRPPARAASVRPAATAAAKPLRDAAATARPAKGAGTR